MAAITKAELAERYDALLAEHEAFKEAVRAKAIEVAQEHGWCDNGVNETLESLGLDPKTEPEFEITVQVVLTLRGIPNQEPEAQWVRESISGLGRVRLDEDWELTSNEYEIVHVTYEQVP